jgi:hypothetical protein
MRLGNRMLLVNPSDDNPLDATPLNQAIIEDDKGKQYPIRLYPNMSVKRLRREVGLVDAARIKSVQIECDAPFFESFKSLFAEVFPSLKRCEEGSTEPGNYRCPGRAEFRFSGEYFQAIAKIAFHYYLVHNRRGLSGSEAEFAPIRAFVRHGGAKDSFFHDSGKRFAAPFDGEARIFPANWCHILAADETRGPVVVYTQLFAGPGSAPSPTHVTLGTLRGEIVLPPGANVWGHCFTYDRYPTGRYAGSVSGLQLTPLRPVSLSGLWVP